MVLAGVFEVVVAALDETAACTNGDVLAMLEVGIAEAVSGAETAEATASSPAGTKGTSDEALVTDVPVDRERCPPGLVCQLPEWASVNERLQVRSEKHKRMERCMTCICNRRKNAQRENDGCSYGRSTYLNVLSQYVTLSGWLLKQATCDWHILRRMQRQFGAQDAVFLSKPIR